ncbi:MAG: aminopeptidase P family protein [Pseudomonadota bacterium]
MLQSFDPVSDRSFAGKHLPLLRREMESLDLDSFIIPHDDEYQNEYIPAYAERLLWISGFSGSAGAAIVLNDSAVIFTDGRYTLQVRDQVDADFYQYIDITEVSPSEWLKQHLAQGARVGFDPMLHTPSAVEALTSAVEQADGSLCSVETNPIDSAWVDQPPVPSGPILAHPIEFSGVGAEEKLSRIADDLRENDRDAVLIASPPSVAWLLNIRGSDVARTPLPLVRTLVSANGELTLYTDAKDVTDALANDFGNRLSIKPHADMVYDLKALGETSGSLAFDFDSTPNHFKTIAEEAGASVYHITDPCLLPRAQKNNVELEGSRQAHIRDGVSVTRFLHWMALNAQDGSIDEIRAAQKLEEFRHKGGDLIDISFDSISATGPNGPHCHYRVTTESNRQLNPGDLFLIDSGAQYKDGTTDITRTIPIGTPTEEMRDRFSRVLKGHIAIALSKFPNGTTGGHLDALARRPLWDVGLDYDHGTGHGVGSFLGVHEGPQRIAKAGSSQKLLPGMILSNEPGFYKPNEFGIRIENLVIVTAPAAVKGGDRNMMSFETITLAPIDRSLIVKDLLSAEELNWLNQYHARVRDTLTPHLDDDVAAWLADMTRPL